MTEQNYITENLPDDLILLNDLDTDDQARIKLLFYEKKLTRYKTENGWAFSENEFKLLNEPITDEPNIPDDLIPIKELNAKDYARIQYLMKQDKIKTYKIGANAKEIYFSPTEFENVKVPCQSKVPAYKIDLSTPTRINCLYKRLTEMSYSNKRICQRDDKLTRYKDEKGYICINLKEYIKPQTKLLAKKLECREADVVAVLFDLIQAIYKNNKGE